MLPELPRVLNKREADFGIRLRAWLKTHPRHSCAMEIKQTTNDYIAFSALEPHQAEYLKAIKSDTGTLIRVIGGNGEPDYIYTRNMPANVVIKYPAEFSIIDIDTFLMESASSKRRSLTRLRARELSTVTVML
jgi:hypothetical protein